MAPPKEVQLKKHAGGLSTSTDDSMATTQPDVGNDKVYEPEDSWSNNITCGTRRRPQTLLGNLGRMLQMEYNVAQARLALQQESPQPTTIQRAKSRLSSSNDAIRLMVSSSGSPREVHHFWDDGMAVHVEGSTVVAIEVFGDAHPFHLRGRGQNLADGISFGDHRDQVELILGPPTEEVGNGWIYYERYVSERNCLGARTVSLGLQFLAPKVKAKPKEKGGKESKAKKGDNDTKASKDTKEGKGSIDEKAANGDIVTGDENCVKGSEGKEEEAVAVKDATKMNGVVEEGGKIKKEASKEKADKEEKVAAPAATLQVVRIMPAVKSSKTERTEAMNSFIIQAAGHEQTFQRVSEALIVKDGTTDERTTYESIFGTPLEPFAPRCFRAVEDPNTEGGHHLYLEDLTAPYIAPCVMDIKIGTRTFLESEVDNPKKRMDLLEKMMKVDASAPTAQEREEGITKLRYMQFREMMSSSSNMGWRIEGIRLPSQTHEDCKTLKEYSDLKKALLWFVQSRVPEARRIHSRLVELREELEKSDWFFSHEVISSSLLFIYDAAHNGTAQASVWMIDFAKTMKVPDGGKLTHRKPWVNGNHEDGFLFGLDSLIQIWGDIGEVNDDVGSA
mmetsp:Transcript_38081/g.94663  ORF Transcript_38081/g.94663 Transcript_38081/m.94663 type:complete len:618 (+) Transcript_38081:360-2213(+)